MYIWMEMLLLTLVDVFPIMQSTGAESNDDIFMLPSHAGLGVLLSSSTGVNCITNWLESDTLSYEIKSYKYYASTLWHICSLWIVTLLMTVCIKISS